jgi:hypothetical protein
VSAPAAWADAPSLRACELCLHHESVGGELHCGNALVAGPARRVPCNSARRRNGGCGPDADHLHWPAIELHGGRQYARSAA